MQPSDPLVPTVIDEKLSSLYGPQLKSRMSLNRIIILLSEAEFCIQNIYAMRAYSTILIVTLSQGQDLAAIKREGNY